MKTTRLIVAVGLVFGSYTLSHAQSTVESTNPAPAKKEAATKLNKEKIKDALIDRQSSSVQLQTKSNSKELKAVPVRTREGLKRKEETSTK